MDLVLNVTLTDPRYCNGCPLLRYGCGAYHTECAVTGKRVYDFSGFVYSRPDWCPLAKDKAKEALLDVIENSRHCEECSASFIAEEALCATTNG